MHLTIDQIHLFHIIVLSVVLYIGVCGRKTPQELFTILAVVAAAGILYHGGMLVRNHI
tara:strand:- start:666 stop:839 length:174 start_codon:yes stop_codon:yes gene_type:complete